MLDPKNTVLVIVDVQGNLAMAMFDRESLFRQLRVLIQGARALGLPLIWLEQLPDKLGPTIPEIAELLTELKPIAKGCFSCCGSDAFLDALKASGRKQVLLAGIESHVCVGQTALDLLELGFEVHAIADAVSSRTAENRRIGLDRIRDAGGTVSSVEMAMFELARDAAHPAFKTLLKLVK